MVLKDGKEHGIPTGTVCVVTYRYHPLKYPKGCPWLGRSLFATEEPTGGPWIENGRLGLTAGVIKGTIPENCTKKSFPISCLRLKCFADNYPTAPTFRITATTNRRRV